MSESEAAVTRVIYGYTEIRSVTSSVLSYTADQPYITNKLLPDNHMHTKLKELIYLLVFLSRITHVCQITSLNVQNKNSSIHLFYDLC